MFKTNEQFLNISSFGILGWNDFNEGDQIEDQELTDIENMVYEGGFISPRPGSTLYKTAPQNRTPLQLSKIIKSDGTEYLIGIFKDTDDKVRFHLLYEGEWYKLNSTYKADYKDRRLGYITWNKGITNNTDHDTYYACDGSTSFVKWGAAITKVTTTSGTGRNQSLAVENADELSLIHISEPTRPY